MKIFLGGTCNGSTWRDRLIPYLNIDYFNPVVENWTPECQAEELRQREECDIVLYVITPKMKGVYSIAEVVDDSNKRRSKTVLAVLGEDDGITFDAAEWKSLQAVCEMVAHNGAAVCSSLSAAAVHIDIRRQRAGVEPTRPAPKLAEILPRWPNSASAPKQL